MQARAHCGPRRKRPLETRLVRFVECVPVVDVGEVRRHRHDVMQTRSRVRQQPLDAVQHRVRLRRHVAAQQRTRLGIRRNLTGDKKEIARSDRRSISADSRFSQRNRLPATILCHLRARFLTRELTTDNYY